MGKSAILVLEIGIKSILLVPKVYKNLYKILSGTYKYYTVIKKILDEIYCLYYFKLFYMVYYSYNNSRKILLHTKEFGSGYTRPVKNV